MRMRIVKPEYWTDELVATWDSETRLAYVWLWGAADDWGIVKTTAALMRGGAFAYQDMTLGRAREMFDTIVQSRRAVRFDVDGDAYYFIPSWFDHQQPPDPQTPQAPMPPVDCAPEARAFIEAYADRLLKHAEAGLRRRRHNATKLVAAFESLPAEFKARAQGRAMAQGAGTCHGTTVAPAPLGTGEPGNRGTGEPGRGVAPEQMPAAPLAPILSGADAPPLTSQPAKSARQWSKTMTREKAVEVFDYWRMKFNRNDRWLFNGKREKAIRARANDGVSFIEAKLAVLGLYYVAEKDYVGGQKRIDIPAMTEFELAFRDDANLRRFIQLAQPMLDDNHFKVSDDGKMLVDRNGKPVKGWVS